MQHEVHTADCFSNILCRTVWWILSSPGSAGVISAHTLWCTKVLFYGLLTKMWLCSWEMDDRIQNNDSEQWTSFLSHRVFSGSVDICTRPALCYWPPQTTAQLWEPCSGESVRVCGDERGKGQHHKTPHKTRFAHHFYSKDTFIS